MYLTTPLTGFPVKFCDGDGAQKNWKDVPTRWLKTCDDMFIRLDININVLRTEKQTETVKQYRACWGAIKTDGVLCGNTVLSQMLIRKLRQISAKWYSSQKVCQLIALMRRFNMLPMRYKSFHSSQRSSGDSAITAAISTKSPYYWRCISASTKSR